jgi:hypothetical protein
MKNKFQILKELRLHEWSFDKTVKHFTYSEIQLLYKIFKEHLQWCEYSCRLNVKEYKIGLLALDEASKIVRLFQQIKDNIVFNESDLL